jgi:hypothetical protein
MTLKCKSNFNTTKKMTVFFYLFFLQFIVNTNKLGFFEKTIESPNFQKI